MYYFSSSTLLMKIEFEIDSLIARFNASRVRGRRRPGLEAGATTAVEAIVCAIHIS